MKKKKVNNVKADEKRRDTQWKRVKLKGWKRGEHGGENGVEKTVLQREG